MTKKCRRAARCPAPVRVWMLAMVMLGGIAAGGQGGSPAAQGLVRQVDTLVRPVQPRQAPAVGLVDPPQRGALVLVRSSQGVPTERWAVLPFDEYRALLERAGDLDEPVPAPKPTPRDRCPEVAHLAREEADILARWFGPGPLREA